MDLCGQLGDIMDEYSDDDIFDPDFDAQFASDEEEPASTKKIKKSNGTVDRNVDKKSIDPFKPHPIKLRNFLEDAIAVLDELDSSADVREAREIHVAAQSAKANGLTAGRQKTPQTTVPSLVLNGFEVYKDDEKLLRHQHMQKVRRLVGASVVSFRESNTFSMAQHIQAAPELKTLRSRKADMEYIDVSHANQMEYRRSLYSYPMAKELAFQAANKRATEKTVVPRELVVNVWVSRGRNPKTNRDRNILQQLILNCLGCQTLSDIGSHIHCDMDPVLDREAAAVPEVAALKEDQFFFVESTFYSTQMDKEENRARHFHAALQTPEFSSIADKEPTVESIDSVCLLDIEMSLGKPYVYTHGLTGCEHFVVFSDARLLHPLDELDLTKYPRVLYQTRRSSASCFICKKSARYRISGSKRFPHPMTTLCHNCHSSFNLNDIGQAIESALEVSVIPGKADDVMSLDAEEGSDAENESEIDEDEFD